MTGEQDAPNSSNYGAVATDDHAEAPDQRSHGESSQGLGSGARLYLGVLLIVGLSGLVGSVYTRPASCGACCPWFPVSVQLQSTALGTAVITRPISRSNRTASSLSKDAQDIYIYIYACKRRRLASS